MNSREVEGRTLKVRAMDRDLQAKMDSMPPSSGNDDQRDNIRHRSFKSQDGQLPLIPAGFALAAVSKPTPQTRKNPQPQGHYIHSNRNRPPPVDDSRPPPLAVDDRCPPPLELIPRNAPPPLELIPRNAPPPLELIPRNVPAPLELVPRNVPPPLELVPRNVPPPAYSQPRTVETWAHHTPSSYGHEHYRPTSFEGYHQPRMPPAGYQRSPAPPVDAYHRPAPTDGYRYHPSPAPAMNAYRTPAPANRYHRSPALPRDAYQRPPNKFIHYHAPPNNGYREPASYPNTEFRDSGYREPASYPNTEFRDSGYREPASYPNTEFQDSGYHNRSAVSHPVRAVRHYAPKASHDSGFFKPESPRLNSPVHVSPVHVSPVQQNIYVSTDLEDEPEPDEETVVVCVANFPYRTTEDDMFALFEDFSPVDVDIVQNMPTDYEDDFTYALVTLPNLEQAEAAIFELDNTTFRKRPIIVQLLCGEDISFEESGDSIGQISGITRTATPMQHSQGERTTLCERFSHMKMASGARLFH